MDLLIVNDEVRTADGIKNGVNWTECGIENVYVAYDAQEGKDTIQENNVDIILCDIEMPGESGLELLRWIKNQKYELECIFLTCHANFEYAKEAIGLGCQDYILLPARYEEVGNAIRKVVNRILEKRQDAQYAEYGKHFLQESIPQKEKRVSVNESLDKIKEYVLDHLGDSEMTINSIAEQFFFHPVYLNRVFKQKEGIPLSSYILNERMKMAASLLLMEDISKAEIAERVGYNYSSNFHNTFKKYYGCTPFQYQEKNKKNE